jgi:hypothetical protein
VGGGPLTAETERDARASVDASLPEVPPAGGAVVSVVLLVRVGARPAPGACAYVRSLTFGGVTATGPDGGWVANVSTAKDGTPPAC